MTDMPDFDSMTPEEMMKWMESLAKRQGATEGLTTDADMDIAEVAADDERLAGKGDYVPYGWTAEKWKEHLAKEEAEKAAKQAAQPPQPAKPVQAQPTQPVQPVQPVPTPQPEPAPQPVAASDAMPDFDSMSPEELIKWMESLALRQGATEGLTTSADMQVAEVSADDERLAGKGDYVPFGWTEEKWKEKLAKEEAEKAAKKAAQPTQSARPAQPQPVVEEDDEGLEEALAANVLEAPSLDDLFAGNNLIEDDADEYEELEEEFEGNVLAAPSLDDLFSGNNQLADDEAAAELPSFDDLFGGATDNTIPELDLSALEGLGAASPGVDNPMDWLAGLAGADEGLPDLDMNALSSLAALGGDDAEADTEASPMDWLAGLAEDGDIEDEQETEEGSLAWLETLAKQEGADSEELFTAANLDISVPDNILDEGPGYEDFSFEQGSGMIADSDDDEELTPAFDVDAMDMSDPENWLEQLASAQSGITSVDFDDDDIDEDDAIPTFDEVSGDIREKIDRGEVSPDEILLMFQTAFDKAGKRTDVDDYIDSDDDVEEDIAEAPVQAEIPDWLQEQMNVVPEEPAPVAASPKKGDTAEMMLKNLGLDNEIAETEDLPDWLKGDSGEDTGDIAIDIFDDVEVDFASEVLSDKGTEEVIIADTEDTWVQAFQQEASGELEEWYEERLAEIEGSEPVATPLTEPIVASVTTSIAAVVSGGLQAADLPNELALEHGEPMLLPAWMGGDIPAAADRATVMPMIEATSVDEMDWLDGDSASVDIDMPDWLKEQVDDSVAPAEELPAWLAGDDIDIESVEEIPDWLRETMGEEEAVADVEFAVESESVFVPEPVVQPKQPESVTLPVPVQKSPAPVPRAVAVDVSATLQSAQQKVSAGDIEGAMLDYEAVVRANQALDQVEKAVDKLATSDAYKRNPAVFRVLGDVRMRQGKLQEALDTYRRALNML